MPFERILVAIDGSQGANRALATALDLSLLAGAHLTALTIEGPLPAYAATIGEVEEVRRQKDRFFDAVAQDAREKAEVAGVAIEVEVRAGHAAELITDYARERCADLVVIGHKGHFLQDYVLGSTADRVAHHAHCPVMIVK
jgi:nucleotide-binding universal stress UspA family protein